VRAEQREQVLGKARHLRIDVGLPRQRGVGEPLAALRLLVEVAQILARLLVAPVVGDVELALEPLEREAAKGRGRRGGCLVAHRRGPPREKVKPISCSGIDRSASRQKVKWVS